MLGGHNNHHLSVDLVHLFSATVSKEPLEPAAPLSVTFSDNLRPADGDVAEARPRLSVPKERLVLPVRCRPITP